MNVNKETHKFAIPEIMARIDLRNMLPPRNAIPNNDTATVITTPPSNAIPDNDIATVSATPSRENEILARLHALEIHLANNENDVSISESNNSVSVLQPHVSSVQNTQTNRNMRSVVSSRAIDDENAGPNSRYDRNTMERNPQGCPVRSFSRLSNNRNSQKLIELRISGLPLTLKNDSILTSIKAEPQNNINSIITFISHYTSRYQNASTKIPVIKMKYESAKTIIERVTVIVSTYNYKCSRIVRLKQCTRCLLYDHTLSELIFADFY